MGPNEWLEYIKDDTSECFLACFQSEYHDNQDECSPLDDELNVLRILM